MPKKLISSLIISVLMLISVCIIYHYYYSSSPKKPNVPVLVYHSISNDIFSRNISLFVNPKDFENQIKWIVKNKYTTIFADKISDIQKYKKPVIITFDDGYEDNYNIVFPLVKKYNIKITIFVVTDGIGAEKKLTPNQIIEMYDSGLVSFQSHTKSHPNLLKINSQQLDIELRESRDKLFYLLNEYPTVIAYPFGKANATIVNSVKKYYSCGYSLLTRNISYTDDEYMIRRFGIGRYTTINDIKKYLDNV